MNATKTISTRLNDLGQMLIKVLRFGRIDSRESYQSLPFGIDSNPVKDLVAVYGQSATKGDSYIIGYLQRDMLAEVGEIRTFSTNANGEVQFYTFLKNDGTMELNGNNDNLVRYSKLEQAFNELRDDYNDLATKWNTFAAAYTPGSPTSVGTPPAAQTANTSTADITPAKINEIKTFQ